MRQFQFGPPKHTHLIATIIVLSAVTVSLTAALYNVFKAPVITVPVPLVLKPVIIQQIEKVKPIQPSASLPLRLKIPKIGVNAGLDYVGLTSTGAMGVPPGPSTAAWFQDGPRPGDIGSAVIDGHFGIWKGGIPSVFDNLYKLHKGDELMVEGENGVVITFIVSELRIYDQTQDASDIFSSTDGKAHLNLITCEGVWNRALQSFPSRLVVFADRQ